MANLFILCVEIIFISFVCFGGQPQPKRPTPTQQPYTDNSYPDKCDLCPADPSNRRKWNIKACVLIPGVVEHFCLNGCGRSCRWYRPPCSHTKMLLLILLLLQHQCVLTSQCLPVTNVYLDRCPEGETFPQTNCFVYHLNMHEPMSNHQCSCFENNTLPLL